MRIVGDEQKNFPLQGIILKNNRVKKECNDELIAVQ